MKFGVRIPHSGPLTSTPNIVKVAEVSDKLGFDTVWFHDHVHYEVGPVLAGHMCAGSVELVEGTNYASEPDIYEILSTLAYVSAKTSRVRLGTAILILPQRNPVLVAKQAATLDALSGGRLILGVDIGRYKTEFEMLNIPFKERESKLDEYVELMKKIWTEDPVYFRGKYFRLDGGVFFPKPRNVSLWFGGRRKRAMRRVAKTGDGWIPGGPPSAYEEKYIPTLEKYAEDYGRNMKDIEVGCETYTSIAKTRREAVNIAGSTLERAFGTIERGIESSLVGCPEDIIEKTQRYKDAGVQHMECKFLCKDIESFLEMLNLYKELVLPQF
jgi:probable F420-dependent oxidoreductase